MKSELVTVFSLVATVLVFLIVLQNRNLSVAQDESARSRYTQLAFVGARFNDTANYLLYLSDVQNDGTRKATPNKILGIRKTPNIDVNVCHPFIVFVFVDPLDLLSRYTIRNRQQDNSPRFPMVFVVGDSTNDFELTADQNNEDMLIGNYVDNRKSKAVKQQLMLQYIDSFACKPKFILKHSQDTIVNYRYFAHLVERGAFESDTVYGYLIGAGKAVVRAAGHRWAETFYAWPFREFPAYVQEFVYFMSGQLAANLARVPISVAVEEFNNEDVYLGFRLLISDTKITDDFRLWTDQDDALSYFNITSVDDVPCKDMLAIGSSDMTDEQQESVRELFSERVCEQ